MKRDYPPVQLPPFALLLILSFCEGAAVMIVEISGAKMLAPLFGSSLQVWASVLGITLFALAGGYYSGGMLARKDSAVRSLFLTLMLAGVFTSLMPMLAGSVVPLLIRLPFEAAVILASGLLLFPPVFLMGCFSPLMVEALSRSKKQVNERYTGLVFAVSTLGGITATFLWGFYIIPRFGLKGPVFFTGLLMLILAFVSGKQQLGKYSLLIAFAVLAPAVLNLLPPVTKSPYFRVVYESEGMLGQILVVDYMEQASGGKFVHAGRGLYFNRILQAIELNKDGKKKYGSYVEKIHQLVLRGNLRKNGRVLILGLGSGCLANVLTEEGFSVDAVEFDPRISTVARRYFNLNPAVKVIHDDARHYLNNCSELYDLVVADVFKAEENPPHIITEESLKRIDALCGKNGICIVNGYGFWDGDAGMGTRSIASTLMHAGYKVSRIQTEVKPEEGNQLLIASKRSSLALPEEAIRIPVAPEGALVLSDDRPVLDYLNREAVKTWRNNYNRLSTAVQLQHGLQVFY